MKFEIELKYNPNDSFDVIWNSRKTTITIKSFEITSTGVGGHIDYYVVFSDNGYYAMISEKDLTELLSENNN